MLEFVEILRKHFPAIAYEIVDRDSFRPKRGTLSIKKAEKLIGYRPDYDLEKGIAEYIDFVREHNPFLVELSNKDS